MHDIETLAAAAKGLGQHPQDHGWRDLYRLFAYGLDRPGTHLQDLLADSYKQRQTSATHLLTLLGIALKFQAPAEFTRLARSESYELRLLVLEQTIVEHRPALLDILHSRHNSFTCARRYLATQVVLSSYFSAVPAYSLNFADLGTGIGILPRQLNVEQVYQDFAKDLIWPGGTPEFRMVPITSVFGVDRGPMPDLSWVQACYGRSGYYSEMFGELLRTLDNPTVRGSNVTFQEVDLLDTAALAEFLDKNRINAANMTYVLYELDPMIRAAVVQTVIRNMHPPRVLIVTEPQDELHRQGCIVEVFLNGDVKPLSLCYISDGHFRGHVLPLDDYENFFDKYPIRYSSL